MVSHTRSSIDADGRAPKRRKTRKGTRSCWACKRRKVKCTYARPADDVCIGCARRCLECISQEFPEQDPGPSSKSRLVGDRIGRLESMMQRLAEQVGGSHVASSGSSSTIPVSTGIALPVPSSTHSKHRVLAQTLLEAYPSPRDLCIIGSTGGNLALYLPLEFVTTSHMVEKSVALESEKPWGAQQLQQQYTAETHPVLIARQMLLLACVLQHLHDAGKVARSSSSSSCQQVAELSLPPRALARRLAGLATTMVTAHDRFTTSTLEGLECLWLEAVYHEHSGRLNQSWLACRRAISTAQLMRFHQRRYPPMAPPKSLLQRPDCDVADAHQIWFRLVYRELALCLLLEMPPSASSPDVRATSVGDPVTAEDDATDENDLERRHAVIARHLIERSERDPDFQDLDTAHQIRTELEEAANAMPSDWWRIHSLADHTTDETYDGRNLFGAMKKLRTQIIHAYLRLIADLPFMLQAGCSEPTTPTNGLDSHHNHSRNKLLRSGSLSTCIEASRDLLCRFIQLRSCNRAEGYFRLLDHYAWLAAAMLLLARLLDHRETTTTTTTTSLGGVHHQQQRLSDRTMAFEAMERMRLAAVEEEGDDEGDDEMDYRYSDAAATAKCGTKDMLPRLLALEAGGAAVVVTYRTRGGAMLSSSSGGVLVEGDKDAIVFRIPFVGLVSITPGDRHESAVRGSCSLLSGTTDCLPIVLDDEAEPQGSNGGSEEEEDDDDASLTRVIKLRRSVNWSLAPYMLPPAAGAAGQNSWHGDSLTVNYRGDTQVVIPHATANHLDS